jgi:hypothetical protein
MAIKDLYKNRLTKKNVTLQPTNSNGNTSAQASTYDGNGIVQNQGNSLVGSNSTQPNTTNQSTWVDSLRNAGQNIGNKVNNFATNFFNALQTYADNNKTAASVNSNATWKDYADLINAKTANSKVELQTAMQRAQSASNDYLKALGLQGSGLGQSQLTDIGAQYQNALSNINRQAESDVNAQLDNDFREMVDNGASSQEIENYIKQYGEQTGLTNSWNNYVSGVGKDLEGSITKATNNIQEMIDSQTYDTITNNALHNLQFKLNNASSQQEYNDLIKENEALLSDPGHFTYISQYTNGKADDNWTSGLSSSSVPKLKKALQNAIDTGKIGNGSTVVFDDENKNSKFYLYTSGKLYKLDMSKISQANNWKAYQFYYDGTGVKETDGVQIWG